jgi:hypothetical protein
MARITVDVRDDKKAEFFALLQKLDYIKTRPDAEQKLWDGGLPVFDKPVYAGGSVTYTREELHER